MEQDQRIRCSHAYGDLQLQDQEVLLVRHYYCIIALTNYNCKRKTIKTSITTMPQLFLKISGLFSSSLPLFALKYINLISLRE